MGRTINFNMCLIGFPEEHRKWKESILRDIWELPWIIKTQESQDKEAVYDEKFEGKKTKTTENCKGQ